MDNDMSSNINELSNMQKLSNNIQQELDDGKASDYLNQDGLVELQQMQLKQLQDLQKIQELQLRKQNQKDNDDEDDDETESEKPRKKKKKQNSNEMIKLLQDPMIVLALYIFVSHPTVLGMVGKYVPNLNEGEDGLSLINLLIRGIILISIYFGLKMFILN